MATPTRIVDAHVHLYDLQHNHHAFLEQVAPGYEAFVGNYDRLPRHYVLEDYLADTQGHPVEAIVWHEFLSADPIREAVWAHRMAEQGGLRHALVAKISLLDTHLEATLEQYATLSHLTAVREHLVWDEANPLKRFATRPDLLRLPHWRAPLRLLERHRFKCGLEVFAHQLTDLYDVVRQHPNIGFTIGVMGWPLDVGPEGFVRWRHDLEMLARCEHTCLNISALECIFGMHWSEADALPWFHAALEGFGPQRCMLGSHLPIARLSVGFDEVYRRYERMAQGLTATEVDALFYGTAQRWFNPT